MRWCVLCVCCMHLCRPLPRAVQRCTWHGAHDMVHMILLHAPVPPAPEQHDEVDAGRKYQRWSIEKIHLEGTQQHAHLATQAHAHLYTHMRK